jgi:hypothetical protein
VIVSEALHPTAAADVAGLLDALAEAMTAVWGVPRHRVILTAAASRLEFALDQ